MTTQGFKEKFKVGDKISHKLWDKGQYVKILYIGEYKFFYADEEEEEFSSDINDNWQHYKEPVKKDLEGLKKWYILLSNDNGDGDVYLADFYGWKKERPDSNGDHEEYITEEEAIERGLKL